MLIVGTLLAVTVALGLLGAQWPRPSAVFAVGRAVAVTATLALVALATFGGRPADAAIVPTVGLGTAADYSALAASTVTNIGPSVLNGSVGVWEGSSVTGFPPGIVVPPATIDVTNGVAQQAQSDLTAAYTDAMGRPLNATTTADLTDLILVGGVYAGPAKGALELTGPLVLDGGNDLSSVFIFQTDSTLTTATGSSVTLINGAQACNVFWQIGSSATLGSGSVFVGNIMALASVTVNNGVVVEGRALASTGAVTLENDTFTAPSCAPSTEPTTTTTGTGATTLPGTATTLPGEGTTTPSDVTTMPGGVTTTPGDFAPSDVPAGIPSQTSTTPLPPLPIALPATGAGDGALAAGAALTLVVGLGTWRLARRPKPSGGL